MTVSRIAPFLAVIILTIGAHAELRVRILAAPGADRCLAGLHVITQPESGDSTRTALPKGAASVVVPHKRTDRVIVRANAEGCWSETLEADPSIAEVALRLYRAGQATGTLEVESGEWPRTFTAAVFRAPESPAHGLSAAEGGHRVECHVSRPQWQCTVPVDVPFDLVARADGFAPLYYWSILARDDVQLEPRPLRKGASIAGWVEDAQGNPLQGARVSVLPAATAQADMSRGGARALAVQTNARGFFQIPGLDEGEYLLVSRAEGLSPAVLPVVNLRAGEALVWPRQITHLPYAELEITLSPRRDANGKEWVVAATEITPFVAPPPPPLRYAATGGVWRARTLRSDTYRIQIEDANNAVLQTLVVDLSKSGTTHLPLTITRRLVRGVLEFGDIPIAATIRFATLNGRAISTKTDEQGHFEVSFPEAGKWIPTVFPGGPNGPRITADPIDVPDVQEDQTINITLPGGRVRGTVVDQQGRKVRAAVHVARDGSLAAQFVTGENGTFDFIGIKPGNYTVDAEGELGSARSPTVHVAKGETADLTLRLQPYRRVRAVILTPNRAPASGALVRVSTDHGLSWSDLYAKVDGSFEYDVGAGAQSLYAIVLTHSYPALLAQLVPEADATLVLQSRGGMLRAPYRTYLVGAGSRAPFQMFFMPSSRDALSGGAAYLEPGAYHACPDLQLSERCRAITINPGTDTVVDAWAKERTKEP